jgi:hypothetical protein
MQACLAKQKIKENSSHRITAPDNKGNSFLLLIEKEFKNLIIPD